VIGSTIRIKAVNLEEDKYIQTEKEVELLLNYFKLVKKIFLSAIVIIIFLFAFFMFIYSLDLYKHPLILGAFIIIIIVLYSVSMILLMNFKKKVKRLKDKL